jgi:hypothetical protein
MMRQNDTADQTFGNSGGENPDQMANVNIAEWLLGQRMNSVTRLRLAKRLRAFISA